MNPRLINAGAGVVLLVVAGLLAAEFFLVHNTFEDRPLWFLGLLATAFLVLIGLAESLVYRSVFP